MEQVPRQAPTREPAPLSTRDLELLRLLGARDARSVESEVRGSSMGEAIPDGARIRIVPAARDATWREGQVVAFLAGTRLMAHRVVHVGRARGARYVITQGDGNWFCDPPVALEVVAGEVRECCVEGSWRDVGPSDSSALRRVIAYPVLALLRTVLAVSPGAASRIARIFSRVRMAVRATWLALRQVAISNVRH
jgi:hypothetical protein